MSMNQPTGEYRPPSPPPPGPAPAPGMVPVSTPTAPPVVTYTILGITVLVYLLQMASQYIYGYDLPVGLGAKANDAIRAGQLWRFFTPMLLHGSVLHIGFNMYALFIFGNSLERRYGHGRFLLLYILSGFAGAVFSFLFSSAYSVGASGAIFGLIAAEGIFLYKNRKLFGARVRSEINNIVFVIVLNLFLGLQPGIDNWGHIGGLMGGLIFAWFAGPQWEVQGIIPNLHVVDQREPRDVITGAVMVAIIFGILAAIGIWYPFVK